MLGLILFILGIIINAGITLWLVSVKVHQIKKDKAYIHEIRSEMAEFMAALEENVAGYVALMEKMRQDADSVLESVNRKLRVVEKESQKLEQSRQTYNTLSKHKPLVASIVDIQKQSSLRDNARSSSYEAQEVHATSVQSSSISSMQGLSEQLRDATQGIRHGQEQAKEETEVKKTQAPKNLSAQIASMWRDGKDAKEIAEQLNLSMGEVELALELMGSRRR